MPRMLSASAPSVEAEQSISPPVPLNAGSVCHVAQPPDRVPARPVHVASRLAERRELTQRQKEVLTFIQRHIEQTGYPPTLREIGTNFGIRSTNGVNDHLKALIRKGYLAKDDWHSRALRIVGGPSVRPPHEQHQAALEELRDARMLLSRALRILLKSPSLSAEATVLAGDIREVLR